MAKLNLQTAVYGTDGYNTDLKLTEHDLETLRQMIRMQWLYRIQLLSPKNVREFDTRGMENYHEVSDLIDHASAWPKPARVLPREAVHTIRNMEFFKKIEKELGMFSISDEEHLGWENIYWRLVRPGDKDTGSLHADKWFWEIGEYGEVANFPHTRMKIWIAIYTTPGKNGILIAPSSHKKKNWRWHAEERYGLKKPIFDGPKEDLNLVLLPLSPGESVIFHDELIHGGAPNIAETTRISLEFTMLIPTQTNRNLNSELTMVN